MQPLRVVSCTPFFKQDYKVVGAHREPSLCEFMMSDGEIVSAVISTYNGTHRHFWAKELIIMLMDPCSNVTINGLRMDDGNKLDVSNTYAIRLFERRHYDLNSCYSLVADTFDVVLVGVHYRVHRTTVSSISTNVSNILGFRFYMAHSIVDMTLEETSELLKKVYVPELSVVGDSVYIDDNSITNKFYIINAKMEEGVHYLELIRPEDIVPIRSTKI